MTLRALAVAILVLSVRNANGQQPAISQTGMAAQSNLDALVAGSPTVVPRGGSEGVIGSPYVDNRWLPAYITLSNKVPLAPIPLKYDVLNRRLLMRPITRPNDSLQLDDQRVVRFELEEPNTGLQGKKRRVFRRFEEAPEPRQRVSYVEVLHEGRYSLLKHYNKVLRKANPGPYNVEVRYDELEDKNTYYLRSPDATVMPIKLNNKALQAAAPGLAKALKESAAAKTAKTDAEWVAVLEAIDSK
ncbi:hypothetical protein J0X19_01180 [Hymenobacter sp. BT186]|uniref:Uncharacterized protein n=1 Tax=Hymenobacter telluris TaxID=2816474 RepID=A0A939JAS3_9BACT|nr:hypothetical protein [Hymenobacter telluris]MBO0356545.1 hypothetical protein [Hymenobacter telluris]MBW3372570.1 hypothetical protein [Hymenobacter norwichensis]